MKESYHEGIASHMGLESCLDLPRGGGEALTGASANENTNLYQANELNQYTNINEGAVEPVYDPDGNMTQLGPWAYDWDGENRLIFVSSNGVHVVQNQYDYMSRRVMKATATQTNTFLYDGWNLVREDLGAAAPSSRSYVWGLDLSQSLQGAGGVGGLLAILSPDSCLLSPAYDANGNVTDLVDTSGVVVAHYEYDPFGNTVAQSGDQADANPFRFSSKYWDGETGFYYYGYRFYSPELGRWINRDPIGENAGGNLFRFVNNEPISLIDPHGLFALGSIAGGCLKDIAKELFMSGLGKEWDKAMGCRELDDKATVDPDFSSKVCEGLAFDMDLPATYNEKPIGQILLECISKGILKKGLNELLNTITDPLERMFLKKFIENSVDGYTEDAFKNIQVESKIRMYSYCKDKTLRNILNYRTVMTYEGISVPTTDFSEPFKCNAGFAYPHLSGACSCCTKK